MYDAMDTLPDDFWTENELNEMAIDNLLINKYKEGTTHLCIYHLLKNGNETGLAMIVPVDSIVDGQESINKLWAEAGITAVIGAYNDESVLNVHMADALYLLLHKYQYIGKLTLPGSDKVYRYKKWMSELIK